MIPIPAAEWARMSAPEREAFAVLRDLPGLVREHRFASPRRRWRFDFAFPDRKVAIEVEGGVWSRGRHVRGAGFGSDCEKYNAAALAGWMVLRFTPQMIRSGEAERAVREALRSRA